MKFKFKNIVFNNCEKIVFQKIKNTFLVVGHFDLLDSSIKDFMEEISVNRNGTLEVENCKCYVELKKFSFTYSTFEGEYVMEFKIKHNPNYGKEYCRYVSVLNPILSHKNKNLLYI